MNSPYTPHGWSPELAVGLLAIMVLYVLVLSVTFIVMVHRAGQATGSAPNPTPVEPGLEVYRTREAPLPEQRPRSRGRSREKVG